jgi:heme-degrading monooxygenase HmoA
LPGEAAHQSAALFVRDAQYLFLIKRQETIMQAVLRTYSGKGAKELFDVLEKRAAEVEELLRSVKGFVGYTLTRSDDGGFSVTVCNDKAGVDESVQKAKDWIAKNAADTGAAAPKVSEGSVIVHVK